MLKYVKIIKESFNIYLKRKLNKYQEMSTLQEINEFHKEIRYLEMSEYFGGSSEEI